MNSQSMKEAIAMLDGEWKAVEAVFGGQMLPENAAKNIKLIMSDGNYTVENDRGLCELESNVTPNSMNVIGIEGPNQGKNIPAIYELEGDTLKICYDLACRQRPKEFASEAGTQFLLITYKRESA